MTLSSSLRQTKKDVCHSDRYLVSGPSNARHLLHPAPWFGCCVISRDWARGGSDWTAIVEGGGIRERHRRKGCGGEWLYLTNNNKLAHTNKLMIL